MFRRFAPCVAPKQFYFKDPTSGRRFDGSSIQDVAAKVRTYRMQNEFHDLPYLEAVIENFLCKQSENQGGCEALPKLKRGLMETLQGGVAILKSMMYESFAPQEKADARSTICLTCPLNEFPDKGPFVQWINDIAEDSVGDRKSKYHDELGVCAGCGCPIRSKVFYNEPIKLNKRQKKVIEQSQPSCWQLDPNG